MLTNYLKELSDTSVNKGKTLSCVHTFAPVYDERSAVLILGSFPSAKSREEGFYYAHPQNRFWKVLSAITGENFQVSEEEKIVLLKKYRIALYDTCLSCDITGASDASIENVVPTDLSPIFSGKVLPVYANGRVAAKFAVKYHHLESVVCLPSTSPANARFKLEELVEAWRVLEPYLVG